jgi:NADH dehydrogenase FAD-containing subunit
MNGTFTAFRWRSTSPRRSSSTDDTLPDANTITVVGGGATGVELCAELHNAMRVRASYGLAHVDPDRNVRIVLIEAGPRILPALPERLSIEAHKLLDALGIEVMTGRRVTGVDADVTDASGGVSELQGGLNLDSTSRRGRSGGAQYTPYAPAWDDVH